MALLCGASKGFMKALKAFIKLFEAPQRSVKIKNLIFCHRPGLWQEGLTNPAFIYFLEVSNGKARTVFKVCLKLPIKMPERHC